MPTETVRHLPLGDALAQLDVSEQGCQLCRDEVDETGIATGHVAAGHPAPRRVVHVMAGMTGADWDFDKVVALLTRASQLVVIPRRTFAGATGHGVGALSTWDAKDTERRWFAVATKREDIEDAD